jgi:hypothetical protein
LDNILGEVGVDDDSASPGEQASVMRGVRGGHAMLRAELGTSVRAAGARADVGHRARCFWIHEPSVTPGARLPHR